MKYAQIDNALFIKNRKKFMAQMRPKSIAVFNSNDIYPIGADSTLPFEQDTGHFLLEWSRPRGNYIVIVSGCHGPKAQGNLICSRDK